MLQDMWNAPPGFRPTKSAPTSPAKPLGVSRTRSESFHAIHKVPVGDTPYVRAKNVQLVEKDPEKAIPLFWAAINAGDRVDSALKDMAIVMKQQNRAEEAIEAIKSLRSRCSDQAQESLDNILLDLYKRCGRLDDQIGLLKHKLFLIQQGLAFNGKRTKTARSQGKKFQVSVEQEATRLLGNLGWALMQQSNYIEAEDAYRRALSIASDNNKMCNLGICLMKQGRITEAKETLRRVKPAVLDGPRGVDSHLKAYERAQQMLKDLESDMMNKGLDRVEQSRLFDAFLGSSSIWQPQPCKDNNIIIPTTTRTNQFHDDFGNENVDSNVIAQQRKNLKQFAPFVNALNVDAQPFFSTKLVNEPQPPIGNPFNETLKRTRSGNAASSNRGNEIGAVKSLNFSLPLAEPGKPEPKSRRLSDETEHGLSKFLPDIEDFENAILAAVLGPANGEKKEAETRNNTGMNLPKVEKKIEKRLRVFQDITLSLSPRA
ncbi:Tetratricopeptide repeat (TPR)-like superfamily protein [Euphorbia peplus]|nr:Tetratricopeptide repeat (TPR)-like superfamily protein [Euphorbia peplus]